jgi:Helix-turn-helix domain
MTPIRTLAGDESPPRMFTRGDAMKVLRIGETSLHWLTRTGKLQAVRIGGRVLIPATEIERLCRKGTTLSEAEKTAARGQIAHHRGRSRRTGAARKQSP